MRKLSIAGSPAIIPRSGWQADETIRRAPPQYAGTLSFALVHHTVNTNDYSPEQSAAIVRGIEIYHVKGNGWNDIGYNFLVDRYGQVFEGRYGGVDKNVIGAHSQGFNTGSVGVAVIGTFDKTGIPPAARTALEQLLAEEREQVVRTGPGQVDVLRAAADRGLRQMVGPDAERVRGDQRQGFDIASASRQLPPERAEDETGRAVHHHETSAAGATDAVGRPR